MSLNKFMHPRNRYKFIKPNFEALSVLYPEFKKYVSEGPKPGKLIYDFKNPDAIRVFTTCLLKEDFGFDIEIPPDRLVPTLPLRLNYVLWIEDIISDWGKQALSGIDIGTGGCCIYPLLAISRNNVQFLATESDDVNFNYAERNIAANNLAEKVTVVKVDSSVILEDAIGSSSKKYDFCMCNPPFFVDHFEAQGLVSRTSHRPEPQTISTASPQEGIAEGGEVGFVKRMIEESVFLGDKVRVYTTMLGKKASLSPLKDILHQHKVPNFATTHFCQGKTMRWGLAWSFDKTVSFPKSEFEKNKKDTKKSKSLVHVLPTQMGERREHVSSLVSFLKQAFADLQIHCREGKSTKYFSHMTITAANNTWIHSRRKRRHLMRQAEASTQMVCADVASTSEDMITQPGTSAADVASTSKDMITQPGTSAADVASTSKDMITQPGTSAADVASTSKDMITQPGTGAVEISSSGTDNGTTCNTHDQGSRSCKHGQKSESEMKEVDKKEEVDRKVASDSATLREEEGMLCGQTNEQKADPPSNNATNTEEVRKRKAKEINNQSSIGHVEAEETVSAKRQKINNSEDEEAFSSNGQIKDYSVDEAESISDNVTSPYEEMRNEMPVAKSEAEIASEGSRPPSQYVLKCHATVRVQNGDLALELTWLHGTDTQLLHQLMQHLKNRLSTRATTT